MVKKPLLAVLALVLVGAGCGESSSGTEIGEPAATTSAAPDVVAPAGEQALMGRVRDGFSDSSQVADIDGAVVCTYVRTEKNVDEAAQLAGAEIYSLGFETSDEVYATFIAGGCDLVADDYSTLVNLRERQQPTDQQWVLFGLGLNPSSPSATTPTTKPKPTATKASSGTVNESVGEQNARESAAGYLKYSAFSRSGLIDQLEYEGFTTTQAEYGANAVGY